jgi:hypothetical protein
VALCLSRVGDRESITGFKWFPVNSLKICDELVDEWLLLAGASGNGFVWQFSGGGLIGVMQVSSSTQGDMDNHDPG